MPSSEVRVYLDGNAADENRMDRISDIKVDQGIGMATEAELQLAVGADEAGRWADLEEDFAQPSRRVRVEIRAGSGDFVPLIDGPVVAQRFSLSAAPNESRMTLVVHDDSVLLNQNEGVELYENQAPHEIARDLFQQYGLSAEVDSSASPGGGLTRYIVQRGTAMQLLRELARRHGMFVYVRPGDRPGNSIGVFKRPDPQTGELPGLLLMGAERNVNAFTAQFDALRPITARAASVSITDKSTRSSETEQSDLTAQGDEPVHDLVTPGQVLLARTREDASDLDAATVAAVNHSSWAYSADAEVVADMYPAVLSPYRVIRVGGVGGQLSGDYLISRVTHLIDDESYKQRISLRRNARTGAGAADALPGGIF